MERDPRDEPSRYLVRKSSRTHPDLRKLSIQQADEELASSKKAIADATGRPVDTLAYPYGAYDAAVRNLARQHFRLACSTHLGFG